MCKIRWDFFNPSDDSDDEDEDSDDSDDDIVDSNNVYPGFK